MSVSIYEISVPIVLCHVILTSDQLQDLCMNGLKIKFI